MMQTAEHKPPIGQRVIVIRQSGDRRVARRDFKPNTIWRDPDALHWLSDDDKFMDVKFDPIIAWLPLEEANMGDHNCEVCGKSLDPTLPLLTVCRRCLDLRDILMPLMRNEQAKAFLISQCLDADTADSIVDMDAVRDKMGVGPRTNPRRKAWRKLVRLAKNLTRR